MTYENMANDLHAFVLSKGLNKFTLMGVCIGGRVAIQYSTMYPEFMDGLCLVEAGVGKFDMPQIDEIIDVIIQINSHDKQLTLE
jgi:pimeloyl-ACP methyl ester carboxylesterase